MMFPTRLPRTLRDFGTREDGALSIEAAVILPVMGFMYVAAFSYFDAYRREAVMTKAAYAVGDLLSREEAAVTAVDFEGLQDLFELLTFSEGNTRLRITELQRDGDDLDITWSYGTDGSQEMTANILEGMRDRVPPLADNERVVIVESFAEYEPFFRVGLLERTFHRFIPTSQRYAARLDFDDTVQPVQVETTSIGSEDTGSNNGNNGWGNGDQDAPGNSGDNNNAENSDTCHQIHGCGSG